MDVIIMPSTTSLVARLQTDFPNIQFEPSDDFRWSPLKQTIFYNTDSDDLPSLLHELSHALLGHNHYLRDVHLIELERAAWEHAKQALSSTYRVTITEEQVEDSLDTYRDWLHARSTCPQCNATGLQIKQDRYKCLSCPTTWRVNDARTCALRRYTSKL